MTILRIRLETIEDGSNVPVPFDAMEVGQKAMLTGYDMRLALKSAIGESIDAWCDQRKQELAIIAMRKARDTAFDEVVTELSRTKEDGDVPF